MSADPSPSNPPRADPPAAYLVTVDDDPSVSRSIARDLRRRYGDTHRVLRATSGDDALSALREVKLAGGRIAVLLADYRMPGMTGIEFLEAAMDLFPRARRALLTAYADTDAAIAAINVVDVDHYLLKPWDPPEEKLYPVLDAMIEAYAAEPDVEMHETKVIGHRWSAPSFAARDFLARNTIPYRWIPADSDNGRRLLLAATLDGSELPVVVTADGDVLVAPTTAALAAAVGLATTPTTDFYDLVVVGAGPAGLGAAVYGASEGLRTLLIEREATGGQAGQSSRIENYLGFPDGVSGSQLTDRARRQALKFGTEILSACEATALAVDGPAHTVHLSNGAAVSAHAVVVSTGVSYRRLEAEGVDRLTGRGVYYGSAATQLEDCADDDVLIVGGANSAGQAAVFFSRSARSVTLVIRGKSLEAGMSHYLVEQLRAIDTVHVRTGTAILELRGDDHLESATLIDLSDGTTEEVRTGHAFVFIGAVPRTEWLDGTIRRDDHGFVLTGPDLVVDGERPTGWAVDRDPWLLEASAPGVFIAGDVRADSVKRVASAVGEGAMAVTLVHRYLAGS